MALSYAADSTGRRRVGQVFLFGLLAFFAVQTSAEVFVQSMTDTVCIPRQNEVHMWVCEFVSLEDPCHPYCMVEAVQGVVVQ